MLDSVDKIKKYVVERDKNQEKNGKEKQKI